MHQSYPNTMLTGQNSDPEPLRRSRRRRRRPILVGGRRRLEEYAPRHRAEDER